MEPFADVLRAAARQVFPGCEVSIVDSIGLRVNDGSGWTAEYWCSLAERDSRGLPFAERVGVTADYLRMLLVEGEEHDEPPWDRLMPLIRPASVLHEPRIAGKAVNRPLDGRGSCPPGHTAARGDHGSLGQLVEILGLDHPDVTTMVTASEADRWRAPVEQMHHVARSNLARHDMETQVLPIGATGQGAVYVVGPRGYEPSWMVFPGLFASLMTEAANPVRGLSRQLVFPVSRNEMFVLPEADEDAVAAALHYAADLYVSDRRSMLPFALVCEGGALVPWRLPGSPLARGSWLQRRQFVRDQYAAQTWLLTEDPRHAQGLAERRQVAPPVAGYGTVPTAVVVDAHGDEPLLPEVEYVDLRSDRGRVVVPWEEVARVAGLRPVEGYWPSRWTMGARPGRRRLWKALRAAQVDPEVLERED